MKEERLKAKIQEVADLKAKFEKASAIIILDYRGLNVKQDTELRGKFREANIEYKVYKNRVAKRAFNEMGITDFDEALNDTTSIAISYDDIVAPAKIAVDAIKDFNKMNIKAGLAEGKVRTVDEIKALAAIPPKNVLIAQLLGMLTMPIRSLAVVLDQQAQKLAN